MRGEREKGIADVKWEGKKEGMLKGRGEGGNDKEE